MVSRPLDIHTLQYTHFSYCYYKSLQIKTELISRILRRAQPDSNWWPLDLQTNAVPLSYKPNHIWIKFIFSWFCYRNQNVRQLLHLRDEIPAATIQQRNEKCLLVFVLSYDIETEHRETDNDQVKSVFVLSYDIERSIERDGD